MPQGSIKNPLFFQKCGRRGGLKRSRTLSTERRKAIAAQAAQARWKNKGGLATSLVSVRLQEPRMKDPVFLEELLSEGSLEQWKKIYQEISDHPFGSTANALEKVLSASKIYGVTPLWKGILQGVRGFHEEEKQKS